MSLKADLFVCFVIMIMYIVFNFETIFVLRGSCRARGSQERCFTGSHDRK